MSCEWKVFRDCGVSFTPKRKCLVNRKCFWCSPRRSHFEEAFNNRNEGDFLQNGVFPSKLSPIGGASGRAPGGRSRELVVAGSGRRQTSLRLLTGFVQASYRPFTGPREHTILLCVCHDKIRTWKGRLVTCDVGLTYHSDDPSCVCVFLREPPSPQ